jgi:two-component system, OmpR family, phosphate regulon sensor histidine kinase PhoR
MPEPTSASSTFQDRLRRVFQPRPASFNRRLTTSVILIVVLTALFGALPAVWVIYHQFQSQIVSRVKEAQIATGQIYATERSRLLDLTHVIAQRPTLCKLALAKDRESLAPYLDTMRRGMHIDALYYLPDGQEPILSGTIPVSIPEDLSLGRSLPFADYIAQDEPPRLYLVAASEIDSAGECVSDPPGWVMAIQVMDDADMEVLAQQTGLEQSLIVAGRRAATSLPSAPDWPLDPGAAVIVQDTLTSCCTLGSLEKQTYQIGLAPLLDLHGDLVAMTELALPLLALQRAALNSLAILSGAVFLIALFSALVTLSLTNRITRPLSTLVEAVKNFSHGDLEKPIPTHSDWVEINQLADQLEISRRHLEQSFQDNQREMKRVMRLLSATREGMIRLSPSDLITYINPDGESILGIPAAKILYLHYDQVFRPAPGVTTTLSDLLESATGINLANRLVIQDVNNHPLSLTIAVSQVETTGASGNAPDRLLVFRQVNEDLLADRQRSEYLAHLAHEFRTPLSSIAATIELLSEDGSSMSQNEINELTDTALLATHHMQTLIDNVLESAIIEADCFRLRCHPILLRDVIHSAVNIMSPLIKRRQQTLEIDQPRRFLTILADPDRLGQAIVNLLDNASKYSPFESTIELSFKRQGNMLMFTILDSGPGIPDDQLADIFNRFTSFTDRQGARHGIGLGLPVVKTIIEAHGGRVGAENRPEGGARFWFTMPLNPRLEP